jgi:3-oxoadipate enol-lactonase
VTGALTARRRGRSSSLAAVSTSTRGRRRCCHLLASRLGHCTVWDSVIARLLPDVRVVRYDCRGYGASPAPHAEFSGSHRPPNGHVGAGIPAAHIVGHSGGAATELGLALDTPAAVRSLVLIAPGVSDYPWPERYDYFVSF